MIFLIFREALNIKYYTGLYETIEKVIYYLFNMVHDWFFEGICHLKVNRAPFKLNIHFILNYRL